ncbi:MAG TPA: GNAT family N-acetyltransferase [Chloroflexota bacterium]
MACMTAGSITRVSSVDAFDELTPDWDDLHSRSFDNRLFTSSLWYRTWWQHFGVGRPCVFVMREADGEPSGILPLQIVDEGGGRTITLAGDYNVTDYLDTLAAKPCARDILADLWRSALAELSWDRILLRHVPSTSPTIPALQDVLAEDGVTVSVEGDEVSPVALLCSTWDGYLQMLSKKQRHEIRRKMRRALEGSEWSWHTAETADEVERDLPVFFHLHELSGNGKERFMTLAMQAFFHDLALALQERDILRLSVLRRDGKDVAATMSFLYRGRFFLYNSGYDPELASSSPGIAAVALAMQDAIREEAVAFDFLSGNEPYKYQFGATDTHTCVVTADCC